MAVSHLVLAVFALVAVAIGFRVFRGFAEWARNDSQPVLSVPARVVSRRTETTSRASRHPAGHIRTRCFIAFERESGERSEFQVYGQEYGLLAEGDEGSLTSQGTRYYGLRRQGQP